MDEFQSEKEQIDEIKAWWAEYGRYVVAGVVIAVGLLLGFNQYKSSKINAQTEASVLFEQLAGHVVDGDLEDAISISDELASNYANTAYAAQSRLVMARLYMDQNRDQDAADALRDLLAMSGNSALKQVGRMRLARILLYQDKAQEVLDLLAEQTDVGFAGLYAEARGDAHAALGDIDAARAAMEAWQAKNGRNLRSEIEIHAAIGDREGANALAAELDAKPGGFLVLMLGVNYCACGAPFDLEATPVFRERIMESGLDWPPEPLIRYPAKDW